MLRDGAHSAPHMNYSHYGSFVVYDVASPDLKQHVGRMISDIAAERGVDPFDAMLDLALSDDLQTGFLTPRADVRDPDYWAKAAKAVQDPRTVLAGSDAGAHLDMVISYDTATHLVGPAVRDGFITLEGAIRQATDVPARAFGLRDRGRLATGYRADIVIFDETRLLPSAVKQRFDLPGGSWRLTSEAEGLEHVFVNGRHTMTGSRFTGDLPGTVLRSGRDTTSSQR
jgi:N-acyl-D-aspartate/D-glutamate deacylase